LDPFFKVIETGLGDVLAGCHRRIRIQAPDDNGVNAAAGVCQQAQRRIARCAGQIPGQQLQGWALNLLLERIVENFVAFGRNGDGNVAFSEITGVWRKRSYR
jgi:hypothetical protein